MPGEAPDRKTGIWDSDWGTSRYYWTVVPAIPYLTADNKVEYADVAFSEDMCAAGQALPFGKTSSVAAARQSGVPYVSGVTPTGALAAATTKTPRLFGRVLVAWEPTPGAQRYEVQWSKTGAPFRKAGSVVTPSTSTMLELPPDRWFYRVRGLDETLPGARTGMAWSDTVQVTIVPRTFKIEKRRR